MDEEQDEEPLTWREQRELDWAERNRAKARLIRDARHAKDQDLISRLGRLFRVDVGNGIGKQMPPTEPLDNAQSNARENLLRRQREILLAEAQPRLDDEKYRAEREAELRRQKEKLLKG